MMFTRFRQIVFERIKNNFKNNLNFNYLYPYNSLTVILTKHIKLFLKHTTRLNNFIYH